MCAYFFSSSSGCKVICNFVIFQWMKVQKKYMRPMLPPGGRNWLLISPHWVKGKKERTSSAGNTEGEVSLYCWPPVWLVWNQLYDNWQFLFYLQNRLIKTSLTGGQQYGTVNFSPLQDSLSSGIAFYNQFSDSWINRSQGHTKLWNMCPLGPGSCTFIWNAN
jgi:hypothetical protein